MKHLLRALPAALTFTVLGALGSCGKGVPASLSAVLPGSAGRDQPLPFAWPPERGEMYPDVTLLDATGEEVHLSSFRGKVLLVELVGMT